MGILYSFCGVFLIFLGLGVGRIEILGIGVFITGSVVFRCFSYLRLVVVWRYTVFSIVIRRLLVVLRFVLVLVVFFRFVFLFRGYCVFL